uniref:Uncharacterized protein n=1 Tax=viral metagenome TaxID=1070528 RepID=A0A6C0BCN6_9ZZZZ
MARVIKKQVAVGTDPTIAISKILTRFELDSDEDTLEWVNSLSDSDIKESGFITKKFHRVIDEGKTAEQQPPIPMNLRHIIDYVTVKKQIPVEEQRAYLIHVIKPNRRLLQGLKKEGETTEESKRKSSSLKEEQNREVKIDQSQFIVSDRFIFIGGTPEFIGLEVVDISKMKALSGLAPNQQIMEKINVPVRRNEVLHLEMQSAVSMRICVDNKFSYVRPEKKGFRSGIRIQKDPSKRFIVVIDVVAPAEKVRNVLMKKIDIMDDICDSRPHSTQAKMIKSFKDEAAKEENSFGKNNNEKIKVPAEQINLTNDGKEYVEQDFTIESEALDAL